MGLSLLAQSHLPLEFWIDAFSLSACIINHFPTPILSDESQFFKLYHQQPDYSSLKFLGVHVTHSSILILLINLPLKANKAFFLDLAPTIKGIGVLIRSLISSICLVMWYLMSLFFLPFIGFFHLALHVLFCLQRVH
jgi:hypothetical protein